MLKGILKAGSPAGDAAVSLNKKSAFFQDVVNVTVFKEVEVVSHADTASRPAAKYAVELTHGTANLKPPQEKIEAPAQTSFIGSLFQNKKKKKEITYLGNQESKKEKSRIARIERHQAEAIERATKLTNRLASNVAAIHDDKPDIDVLYRQNGYEAILDAAFDYEKKQEARELKKQLAELTWDK